MPYYQRPLNNVFSAGSDRIGVDTFRCGSSFSMQKNNLPQTVFIGVRSPGASSERCFSMKLTDSIGDLRRLAIKRSNLDQVQAINYGLYLPPQGSKQGKFLEDERPIADYPSLFRVQKGRERTGGQQYSPDSGIGPEICLLELNYKSRLNCEDPGQSSRIRKLKAKMSRNHFMDFVRNNDIKMIVKWLDKGFDPNFQSKKDGETPLTLAATIFNPRELIISLVNGGAHMDFRAANARTALHYAAEKGNFEAIRALLDLGQNPNCKDLEGLTPLYLAVSTDTSSRCTQELLYDHAVLGIQNIHGFQEIHQACKANRVQHLENLIMYGADLNARTGKGQTPMHICVMHEAGSCLHLLLVRGADPDGLNDAGQTPLEYCLLTNMNEMAQIIRDFRPNEVVCVKEPPVYNSDRRPTINGPRAAVATCLARNCCGDTVSILSGAIGAGNAACGPYNIRDSPLSMLDRMSVTSSDAAASLIGTNYSRSLPNPVGQSITLVEHTLTPSFRSPFPLETTKLHGSTCESNASGYHMISNRRPIQEICYDNDKSSNAGTRYRKFSAPQRSTNTYTEASTSSSQTRTILLHKDRGGFGFTLHGLSRSNLEQGNLGPFAGAPGNQYFAATVPGGAADLAGAQPGDYVLEVNDIDVSHMSHEEVVHIIDNSGDLLKMHLLRKYSSPLQAGYQSLRDLDYYTQPSTIHGFLDNRARSQDRHSAAIRRRAKSSQAASSNHGTRLYASEQSPASQSKERVFLLHRIDGKTVAVPADKEKVGKGGKEIAQRPVQSSATSDSSSGTLTNNQSDSDDDDEHYSAIPSFGEGKRSHKNENAYRDPSTIPSTDSILRDSNETYNIPRSASCAPHASSYSSDDSDFDVYNPKLPTADAPKSRELCLQKQDRLRFHSSVEAPSASQLSLFSTGSGSTVVDGNVNEQKSNNRHESN